jgi:hypothetical protein
VKTVVRSSSELTAALVIRTEDEVIELYYNEREDVWEVRQ